MKDLIIEKIFEVELTAAELFREGKDSRLTCHLMEVLETVNSAEPPFQYLIACYRRANEVLETINRIIRSHPARSALESICTEAKKLVVSFTRIHLRDPRMFRNTSENRSVVGQNSDVSPLLSLVFSEVSSGIAEVFGSCSGCTQCPPGFLKEFFSDSDDGTLDWILQDLYDDLSKSVTTVSALGDFQQPLRALLFLLRFRAGRKSLVNHPNWIPKRRLESPEDGRNIEMNSILGPFFHISCLPDHTIFNGEPDVRLQCFNEGLNCSPGDLFTRINTVTISLYEGLEKLLLSVLQTEVEENVLEYLAEVINRNFEARIKVDPLSYASTGMFVNLSAVMVQIWERFTEKNLINQDEIDPTYLLCKYRLDLSGSASLYASASEVSEWINKRNQEALTSGSHDPWPYLTNVKPTSRYTIYCECFFMTARILHLGLIKALNHHKYLVYEIDRLERIQRQAPSPQLEVDIADHKKEVKSYSQEKFCLEAQILCDDILIQQAISFYQFMVDWLVKLVGGFQLPLPSTCPMEFASMPDHFVGDAMDMIIHASRIPGALDLVLLDKLMDFIILFMVSPNYVRNHLREQMVEVLKCWVTARSGSSGRFTIFEGQQLSLKYLVESLMKLYVDFKTFASHENLDVLHNILIVLKYLWTVPSHRDAWRQIAKEEEKGLFLKFFHLLIKESFYRLDQIPVLICIGVEAEMENTAEWESIPAVEWVERTQCLLDWEDMILSYMGAATEGMRILAITTEQITAPFLLPEMVDRVVIVLHSSLLQLVDAHAQRQYHSLRNSKECEKGSMKLLKQLVRVYVHLARGDTKNIFVDAISKDCALYDEQLFCDATDELCKTDEDVRTVEEFIKVGEKAKVVASEALNAEAALGDIPKEFIDPIQCLFMKNPVILPSSKMTVDRAVIQRLLLSHETDPYTRCKLTPDMLIPNTELKAKIEEFVMSAFQ